MSYLCTIDGAEPSAYSSIIIYLLIDLSHFSYIVHILCFEYCDCLFVVCVDSVLQLCMYSILTLWLVSSSHVFHSLFLLILIYFADAMFHSMIVFIFISEFCFSSQCL
jgi:hypothetical protein